VKADKEHRPDVEAALRVICDKNEIMLQSTAEITDMIDKMVGGIIGALWVTLALSFVVAAFGVVNTLTMNVLEQTREIGMLRVVAMTRRQVRRVVLAQAAIVGIVGLAPGIVTGLFIAYILNLIMLPVFGYSIRFDPYPVMIAECFFGGLLIILIAAWIPARRAAHLDLTTAMRRE
jgi:putative ABC transport system permease protein